MGGAAVARRDGRWFRSWSHDGAHQAGNSHSYVARHNGSADLYRPNHPCPHHGTGADHNRTRSNDHRARGYDPAAPAGDHRRG